MGVTDGRETLMGRIPMPAGAVRMQIGIPFRRPDGKWDDIWLIQSSEKRMLAGKATFRVDDAIPPPDDNIPNA